MIVTTEDTPLSRTWTQICRQEAGQAKFLFQLARAESPDKQAELITKLAAEGVAGMIIMPDQPETLTTVINDAAAKGIAIVLLDRAVPGVEGKATFLTTNDMAIPAKEIVKSALEDAKAAGFPPEGPAVVLVNNSAAGSVNLRLKALADAAKSAGLTVLPEISFTNSSDQAAKLLAELFEKEPKIAMVLADDDIGLAASQMYRTKLRPLGKYVSAGFGTGEGSLSTVKQGEHTSIGDLNTNLFAKRAIRTLEQKISGKVIADRVEIPVTLYRGPGREMIDQMLLQGPGGDAEAILKPDLTPEAANPK